MLTVCITEINVIPRSGIVCDITRSRVKDFFFDITPVLIKATPGNTLTAVVCAL